MLRYKGMKYFTAATAAMGSERPNTHEFQLWPKAFPVLPRNPMLLT